MSLERELMSVGEEINTVNIRNGWAVVKPQEWEDQYKIPAILALIHSEVSEALEAFRKADRENFAEELADIVIRVLDCAAGLEINLGAEILEKLEKNRQRGYKHGGKRL
jgi:NTP pyrophosphatase (non-canonical NTP hydrolase)